VTVDTSAPPPPLRDLAVPCGSPLVNMRPTGVRMMGGKVPMPEFIRVLSMLLGRPVIDKMGVTGTFDRRREFTPDEVTAGMPRGGPGPLPSGGAEPAADPSAPPNILTAVQEQLGLKLESTKGPVTVLVIDHVERPSEN